MSVQDKIEHIFREIHMLFSNSEPYGNSEDKIVVEKQELFELLKKLNLAVYEAMDEYEVTSQKHQMSQRRSEMRGEEIIKKANLQADDIYAASIIYTDDALNRIQHIMDHANGSVQKIVRRMNAELEEEKNIVRQNQSELKEQLRDFADTKKYLSIIEKQGEYLKADIKESTERKQGKRIQNEGKTYDAVQPEIKMNKAYFERAGKKGTIDETVEEDAGESLARITGKEFAEELRRRAGKIDMPKISGASSEPFKEKMTDEPVKVMVDLDAEYFKRKVPGIKETQKEAESREGKDRRSLFGKRL